jgi:hypothetical protein
MSKFMLSDDDAINDVNPFVTHDFSLPGGVRQTGNFEDFVEVKKVNDLGVMEKSVFCRRFKQAYSLFLDFFGHSHPHSSSIIRKTLKKYSSRDLFVQL